jgi:hypothetical protein
MMLLSGVVTVAPFPMLSRLVWSSSFILFALLERVVWYVRVLYSLFYWREKKHHFEFRTYETKNFTIG